MTASDLVLLHGALGDGRQLAPLAERLTDGRRVTMIELPGHGTTPAPQGPLSIEAFAQAVLGEMDHRAIERADFFGYSMGGYVALFLAGTVPDRVARVMTVATKLAWNVSLHARATALHARDRWGPLWMPARGAVIFGRSATRHPGA